MLIIAVAMPTLTRLTINITTLLARITRLTIIPIITIL